MYRDKYFHNNITVSILAHCDIRANDNAVDTISTNHYLLCNVVDATSKCIVPLAPSVLLL